jgi:hypothetical protein
VGCSADRTWQFLCEECLVAVSSITAKMKIRFKTSIQLRKLVGVILLVCGLQLYGQQKGTIITFDAPGAGTGLYQGTFPLAINPAGLIVGYYLDPNNIPHGFLRARDGTFIKFDPLGVLDSLAPQGTKATGINPALAITGYYYDSSGTPHCFLRAPNGTFTSIDPPGSLGAFDAYPFDTVVINTSGAVAGTFSDPQTGSVRGFLRTSGGSFFAFDAPNSTLTLPNGINPKGAITGYYGDGTHGFLRNPDSTIVTFAPSGSTSTVPTGINSEGTITGYYFDSIGQHGFLRAPNGTFKTFDFPVQPPPFTPGTFVYAINSAETVTGNYFGNNQYHGFLRTRNGTFTSFDPQDSQNTTMPTAINSAGEITGYYPDASPPYLNHGFLRIPAHSDE